MDGDYSLRLCTMVLLACAVGNTVMSARTTWAEQVNVNKIILAMSSPLSGSMPLYTEADLSAFPLKRTSENSVSTNPGLIDVTLIPNAFKSKRIPFVNASTANLLAQ